MGFERFGGLGGFTSIWNIAVSLGYFRKITIFKALDVLSLKFEVRNSKIFLISFNLAMSRFAWRNTRAMCQWHESCWFPNDTNDSWHDTPIFDYKIISDNIARFRLRVRNNFELNRLVAMPIPKQTFDKDSPSRVVQKRTLLFTTRFRQAWPDHRWVL